MITRNAMQLKAFIKKKAQEYNVSAQLVMQNYMLERLLERISLSKYKHNFVIKGGFLISSILGLNIRATMDLDTTVKGVTLSRESIINIFKEISLINIDDNICFELKNVDNIRKDDEYLGLRVFLLANYPPISFPLTVDVTTGDNITPKEIEYSYPLLFDDRSIEIIAYNLENILAEKLETILSRGIANTRSRDFYDVYVITKLRWDSIDFDALKKALLSTLKSRHAEIVINDVESKLLEIEKNSNMNTLWDNFKKKYTYAENISFKETIDSVKRVLNNLFFQ